MVFSLFFFFCFKQKTAYEMRISDWSSDVCASDLLSPGRIRNIEEGFVSRIPDRENLIDMLSAHGLAKHGRAPQDPRAGSVAKIVKLEHAWWRLDGRNDDGFQVAPFPG